jgi:hypothetical protein
MSPSRKRAYSHTRSDPALYALYRAALGLDLLSDPDRISLREREHHIECENQPFLVLCLGLHA